MQRIFIYFLIGNAFLSSCHKEELNEIMQEVAPQDTVVAPSQSVIQSLQVENLPSKTVYVLNESLDLNGLSVKVTYSNGTTTKLQQIPQEWLKGFVSDQPARQLTISIQPTDSLSQQVTTSFTVDILPLVVKENQIVEVVESDFEILEIPEGITSIEEEAFGNLRLPDTIMLPSSLEKIGTYAFYASRNLRKVDMSKTQLKEIPTGTFESCENLTAALLPVTLKKIGGNAFHGTKQLREITVPYGVEEIGNTAFSNSGVISVKLPNSICQISRSFYKCSDLKEISTYGEPYKGNKEERSLTGESFQRCPNLEKLQIPGGVKRIGISVLGNCKVKTLTIPKNVEYIEFNAFGNASSLEKAEVPRETILESNAFPFTTEVIISQ